MAKGTPEAYNFHIDNWENPPVFRAMADVRELAALIARNAGSDGACT